MTLPNLIIPGAAKSGTSSLHESLRHHPDIFMSDRKEPHHFSREPSSDGQRSYEALFEGSDEFAVRGESSTSYLIMPDAPKRINRVLGQPKIIFILRNPVDRVASHYRWLQSLGLEARPVVRAYLADRDQTPSIDRSVLNSGNYRFYHQHSSYGSALERFLECFEKGQIKVLTFERFVTAPAAVMSECFDFLGVSQRGPLRAIQSNATQQVTWIRGVARFLARATYARLPWARPLLGVYLGPVRAAIGLAERTSLFGGDTDLGQDDREWLKRQLADEVQKLRSSWDEDFAEWSGDFPL